MEAGAGADLEAEGWDGIEEGSLETEAGPEADAQAEA